LPRDWKNIPPRRTARPPAAPAANEDPCDCWPAAVLLDC